MQTPSRRRYLVHCSDPRALSDFLRDALEDEGAELLQAIGDPNAPHVLVVLMNDEQAGRLRQRHAADQRLSIEADQPLSPFGGGPDAGKSNMPRNREPSRDGGQDERAGAHEGEGSDAAPSGQAGRKIGARKGQFLLANRSVETLAPMGMSPLPADLLENVLRSQADVEIVDVIKPKSQVGVLGALAAGMGDGSGVMVARMSDEKAGTLQLQSQGRVIVERDQPLFLLDPAFALPGMVAGFSAAGLSPQTVEVTVLGRDNAPIAQAEVSLFGSMLPATGVTDQNGRVRLQLFGETRESLRALYVKPRSDHWSFYQRNPDVDFDEPNLVGLRPLSDWSSLAGFPQKQTLGWGQRAMRLHQLPSQFRGQGVKVAVIDSGAAADTHDDLRNIRFGLDLMHKTDAPGGWTTDQICHGSHCAGVIAGRDSTGGVRGFAPEAEVHVCKLFPGGQVSQLIDALEYCIEHQIDVVNLSLGGAEWSEALEQQIARARRVGIACIVAAGNSGNEVQYPASSPQVLAVAAIGKQGEFPPDSYHAETVGGMVDANGYFSAKFSCHGPQIGVCAPGVAIPSSVPGNNFATWDGTSMAAPHVTGLAALVLAHHPEFQPYRCPRNAERVDRLFRTLKASAQPINVGDVTRTGMGMPDVLIALGLQVSARSAAMASGMGSMIGSMMGGMPGSMVGQMPGRGAPLGGVMGMAPASFDPFRTFYGSPAPGGAEPGSSFGMEQAPLNLPALLSQIASMRTPWWR